MQVKERKGISAVSSLLTKDLSPTYLFLGPLKECKQNLEGERREPLVSCK
jgi:hypothetical protein